MSYEKNYAMNLASMKGTIRALVDLHGMDERVSMQNIKAALVYYWAAANNAHEEVQMRAHGIIWLRCDIDDAGEQATARVLDFPEGRFVLVRTATRTESYGPYKDNKLAQLIANYLTSTTLDEFEKESTRRAIYGSV